MCSSDLTLVDIMGGLIGTVVFTAMILVFEWRVGLVAISPPIMSTSVMGTSISTFPRTVVQTPVTSPRLLSLKYPMGTPFRRFPILIRSFAAIKKPAWVCWFLDMLVVTALPMMLTAIKARAVHAGPFPVSPRVSAIYFVIVALTQIGRAHV